MQAELPTPELEAVFFESKDQLTLNKKLRFQTSCLFFSQFIDNQWLKDENQIKILLKKNRPLIIQPFF